MRFKFSLIFITTAVLVSPALLAQQYVAGFRSVRLTDSTRVYKPGTVPADSLHYRPVELDIWYPAIQPTTPAAFSDLFGLFEQRAVRYQDNADYSGLTEELAAFYVAELGVGADPRALLDIRTESYPDSPSAEGEFPLVLYMAGLNGMGFENYKVLETLAENGYVVVAVWSVGRYPGDMTNEQADMMEQVLDAEFALEHLDELGIMAEVPVTGLLGCSWGGLSSVVLAERNPEIRAVVSFDGSETHYFGSPDSGLYANEALESENDSYISDIQRTLHPEDQSFSYLYLESDHKTSFIPDSVYRYADELPTGPAYLRIRDSQHSDFTSIPSILQVSEKSVQLYDGLDSAALLFFNETLRGEKGFEDFMQRMLAFGRARDTPESVMTPPQMEHVTIKGIIRDQESHDPLPYVNVGIAVREFGTVSDTDGRFELNVPAEYLEDTLRISRVGYAAVEIPVSKLVENELPEIRLAETADQLDAVVISEESLKKKTLGNETTSKFLSTGFSYDQLGAEMGIRINIRHDPTYADAFNFHISYNRLSATTVFRINMYTVEDGRPGENMLSENILATIQPGETGLMSVDLRPYNIVLREDVILTLEWVETRGEVKEGEAIFFSLGMLTTGTLYKKSSQAAFRKHSSFGVGFNLDVQY